MHLKILFVDDEPNVIQGILRSLRPMKDKWDMSFVSSGAEALNIAAKEKFDVIVSDMKMPAMDGYTLLKVIKEKYPQIVRIILSGQYDQKQALDAAKIAHRNISKPCSPEQLKSTIESTLVISEFLKNKELRNIINGIDSLPSLPAAYLKLEKEIKSENVSIQSIVNIISEDVTMTAKILQISNSAFMGLSREITTLSEAVKFLGVEVIKSLVLYVGVFKSFNVHDNHLNFINDLWEHSIEVGNLSREIMKRNNYSSNLFDRAYITGLLHDIGKIVLLEIPDYYEKVVRKIYNNKKLKFINVEKEIYGTTHAEVGAYLMGLWGLPVAIINDISAHHSHYDNSAEFGVVNAVQLANAVLNEWDEEINFFKSKFPAIELTDTITKIHKTA